MNYLMNKSSWMYQQGNERGQSRVEYRDEVEEFLNFTFFHEHLVELEIIRYSCKIFGSMNWGNGETIISQLYQHGFMPRYYVWTSHGELPYQPLSDDVEMLNNDS